MLLLGLKEQLTYGGFDLFFRTNITELLVDDRLSRGAELLDIVLPGKAIAHSSSYLILFRTSVLRVLFIRYMTISKVLFDCMRSVYLCVHV